MNTNQSDRSSKEKRKIIGDTRDTKPQVNQETAIKKLKKIRHKQMRSYSNEFKLNRRHSRNVINRRGKLNKKHKQGENKRKNQKRTTRKRKYEPCISISSDSLILPTKRTRSQLNSHLSHLHIKPEESAVKSKAGSRLSLQSIKPRQNSHLTDLDGLKFYINKKQDGSCTEVTFETKLVLHFKKTAPSDGMGENVSKCINVNQLTKFLSDVRGNSASRSIQNGDSTSLLKYAVHNNRLQSQTNLSGDLKSQNSLSEQIVPVPHSSTSMKSNLFKAIMPPPSQVNGSSEVLNLENKS